MDRPEIGDTLFQDKTPQRVFRQDYYPRKHTKRIKKKIKYLNAAGARLNILADVAGIVNSCRCATDKSLNSGCVETATEVTELPIPRLGLS